MNGLLGFTPVDGFGRLSSHCGVKNTSHSNQAHALEQTNQQIGWLGESLLPQPGAPVTGNRLPEFLRLPKSGTCCPITGLSRSAMNALILGPQPAVRSACLRRPGALRGIRLIPTRDMLDYLNSQIEGGK